MLKSLSVPTTLCTLLELTRKIIFKANVFYWDALDKRLKESNIKFKDNVAGTTTACLGLALHGNEYIPNTILKEDIRNITPKPPGKIFAIFRKPIRQNIYSELTFQSSSIDITKKCLPLDLLKKVDKSLFIQETPS